MGRMVHRTHNDLGWVKAGDEYFLGVDNNIQLVEVKLILGGVIDELLLCKERNYRMLRLNFYSLGGKTRLQR